MKFKLSAHLKVPKFSDNGEDSLLKWIKTHTKNGILNKPLLKDKGVNIPRGYYQNWHDGEFEWENEDLRDKNGVAKRLFALFDNFTTKKSLEVLFRKVYLLSLKQLTISYIDEFLHLIRYKKEMKIAIEVAEKILLISTHKEPIKLALSILGANKLNKNQLEFYKIFGLSSEFAYFVSIALLRNQRVDVMFDLAKKSQSWGRIHYLKKMKTNNYEIKEWMLFEGYKCDLKQYAVIFCLRNGDFFGYLRRKGWNEKFYDNVGEIFSNLLGEYPEYYISDYKSYKKALAAFVEYSMHIEMNVVRFAVLCEIFEYINKYYKRHKHALIEKIKICAKSKNWSQIVLKMPFDWRCMLIAKNLKIDLWEKSFKIAQNDANFKQWYKLTLTNDITRYKRLCEFAKTRFDLETLKGEPTMLHHNQNESYDHLTYIIQNLPKFNEIIGVEFVECALQSPIISNRVIALNVAEFWADNLHFIPENIARALKINAFKEPNKYTKKRYKELLRKIKNLR